MASAANPTITSVPSQKMAITTSHTHRSQSSHKQKRGEEQPEAMWTIYFLIPQSWATATAISLTVHKIQMGILLKGY